MRSSSFPNFEIIFISLFILFLSTASDHCAASAQLILSNIEHIMTTHTQHNIIYLHRAVSTKPIVGINLYPVHPSIRFNHSTNGKHII